MADNPVYSLAMAAYWRNNGFNSGEPNTVFRPEQSTLQVGFLDFARSLAATSSVLSEQTVTLESRGAGPCDPFKFHVTRLQPVVVPSKASRPGRVVYAKDPHWSGQGAVVGYDLEVVFMIVPSEHNPEQLAAVYFDFFGR